MSWRKRTIDREAFRAYLARQGSRVFAAADSARCPLASYVREELIPEATFASAAGTTVLVGRTRGGLFPSTKTAVIPLEPWACAFMRAFDREWVYARLSEVSHTPVEILDAV